MGSNRNVYTVAGMQISWLILEAEGRCLPKTDVWIGFKRWVAMCSVLSAEKHCQQQAGDWKQSDVLGKCQVVKHWWETNMVAGGCNGKCENGRILNQLRSTELLLFLSKALHVLKWMSFQYKILNGKKKGGGLIRYTLAFMWYFKIYTYIYIKYIHVQNTIIFKACNGSVF